MLWLWEIRKVRTLDLIFPSCKMSSWTSWSPRSLSALPKISHWLLPTPRPLPSCSFPTVTAVFACENQFTSRKNTAIGLAKKFVQLVNTLFNKDLRESEKCLFLLKAPLTFWPTQYTGKNHFYNNVIRKNVQIKAPLYSYIFHILYKSSISGRRTWTTRLQKCWTTSGC